MSEFKIDKLGWYEICELDYVENNAYFIIEIIFYDKKTNMFVGRYDHTLHNFYKNGSCENVSKDYKIIKYIGTELPLIKKIPKVYKFDGYIHDNSIKPVTGVLLTYPTSNKKWEIIMKEIIENES